MATIYDSTAATDIPDADHGYVFAYNDGLYSQVAAVRKRFPNARIITISAVGAASADVVDVEPGCVWGPANAVAYVQRERAAGRWPTVYCGRAAWPNVIQAFNAAGMDQPPYWIAHYTNTPHLCSSSCYPSSVGSLVAEATQYGGDLVGHYDATVTNGSWPDDIHAEGSGTQLNPAVLGGALSEEDDMYTDADRARDNFAAQEDRPYRLYRNAAADDSSELGGRVELMAPGLAPWWVPNLDYVSLLQLYRLAGAMIDVPEANVFRFLHDFHAVNAAATSGDVHDTLDRLVANTDLSGIQLPPVLSADELASKLAANLADRLAS